MMDDIAKKRPSVHLKLNHLTIYAVCNADHGAVLSASPSKSTNLKCILIPQSPIQTPTLLMSISDAPSIMSHVQPLSFYYQESSNSPQMWPLD
jgi:hypothetical protein